MRYFLLRRSGLIFAMPVGRNDPCPWGSGKKYKRCHGGQTSAASPDVARANALKAVDVDLSSRLLAFAKSRFGLDWLSDALGDYASIEGLEVPEREMSLAIPWALHFRRDLDDRTVAEAWAAEHARRVSVEQRVLLDAYANAWLSLWEVTRVERGVGAELVDQLTREVRFAHDVSASGSLGVHDTLLAIVLDCDAVSFFGGAHGQPIPPFHADTALREARKICRVRTRAVRPELLRDTQTQLDIIDAWNASVDMMLTTPPPTLTNTDGDPLALTTDDFELTAPRAEVVGRLSSMPGAVEPEEEGNDTVVVFTKAANATHRDWSNTVIGRVVVGERRMRVETNTLRRADALRADVESHLSGMARHRLRQETNTADVMARASALPSQVSRRPARESAQPPEMLAAIRQFREQHMRAWVDDSIPALGGLTPRVAARTPGARRALELLLKDIERSESLLPLSEQIDVTWIRPELGLE